MRSLHQRGRETKKSLSLSSSHLCLMGWGSSSLEILQVCSCADPDSSQLGTSVARRCCRGFLEVYRVPSIWGVYHSLPQPAMVSLEHSVCNEGSIDNNTKNKQGG